MFFFLDFPVKKPAKIRKIKEIVKVWLAIAYKIKVLG